MSDAVETNATAKHNLDFVVADEAPPPAEVRGDVFDRQRVMKGFDQRSVEQQHAFVLGVGGIGSSVAMSLVRLGVSTVYLLDRDVVDASNLNRQILFSLADVGKSKVEVAAQRLKDTHNLRTAIYASHLDAVANWSAVVEIARKCTVIFNNIDYGAVFDYAVNSLCKALTIPYVAGSTFADQIEINFYSGLLDDPCWACCNNTHDSFKLNAAELDSVNDIRALLDEVLCISGEQSGSILDECRRELNSTDASLTRLMTLYQTNVLRLLLPEFIREHRSIQFVPKDRTFPTRTVGSWVGVCVSGACLIVNTWMQYLMKSNRSGSAAHEPIHNWSQVNLSMFDGGYQTSGFSNSQDLPSCAICTNAMHIARPALH